MEISPASNFSTRRSRVCLAASLSAFLSASALAQGFTYLNGVLVDNGAATDHYVANLTGLVMNETFTGGSVNYPIPTNEEVFVNGALFRRQQSPGSTGSGTYIRMYNVDRGSAASDVQGYNYWGNVAKVLDIGNTGGNFTPQVTLGQVPVVSRTVNGVTADYFEFLLDSNQSNSNGSRYISLDQVVIFTSAPGTTAATVPLINTPTTGAQMQMATPASGNPINIRYTMRTASTLATVLVDSYTAGGSGADDMALYVPVSMFIGQGDTAAHYVYLYSQFGGFTGASTAGGNVVRDGANVVQDFAEVSGFEEWSLAPGASYIPEPSTYAALAGLVGLALAGLRRRRS